MNRCVLVAGSLPLDENDSTFAEYYIAVKKLPDGRILGIQPMTYGNYRLQVGNAFTPCILDDGY